MIKLAKGPKPTVLATNERVWAVEYANYLAGIPGTPAVAATRYRHPQVKSAVRAEAKDKCIYCESSFTEAYPGDVEHIIPKAHRPDLVVTWENLGFVCYACNNAKRDQYDAATPALNPFLDDPSAHLEWAGPVCSARHGSARAIVTISVLDLDREDLIIARARRIREIDDLLQARQRETDAGVKQALMVEVQRRVGLDRSYSAALTTYVRWKTGAES